MQEVTFDVPGVSCEHCVNSITKATKGLGVSEVQVDLPSKKVYVAFDPTKVGEQDLKAVIEEEGYDIAGETVGRAIPAAPDEGKKSFSLKSL